MLMNDQVVNNSSILKVLVLVAPVTAESLKKKMESVMKTCRKHISKQRA